jgi:hypothetical protein
MDDERDENASHVDTMLLTSKGRNGSTGVPGKAGHLSRPLLLSLVTHTVTSVVPWSNYSSQTRAATMAQR